MERAKFNALYPLKCFSVRVLCFYGNIREDKYKSESNEMP